METEQYLLESLLAATVLEHARELHARDLVQSLPRYVTVRRTADSMDVERISPDPKSWSECLDEAVDHFAANRDEVLSRLRSRLRP